ncbi:MAG: class I SAM-dependent methyltransferase [Candidatus Aenigmarchaeota archaeon]|nr:class I SAM-dependent methyltransferase [Candidatus Aenigmarchaeota archaeon]
MDKTIEEYDSNASKWSDKFSKLSMERQIRKFMLYLGNNRKVLDIGCGAGKDVKFMIEHGLDAVGVDLSEGMLFEARLRVPTGKFIKMDIRQLEFGDSTFDGVWANASLLHLKKSEFLPALKEVNRILRPSGLFFITMKEGTGEAMDGSRFFSYYSEIELTSILNKAGFDILESHKGEFRGTVWINIFAKKK